MLDNTDEEDAMPSNPLDMFILSHDALRNTRTDQTIPRGWSDRPSKSAGVLAGTGGMLSRQNQSDQERDKLLAALRRGVPSALRCSVWVTNVVRAVHPTRTREECLEYGTLKKVRVLEHGWNIALKQIFPDDSDESDAVTPDLGLGDQHMLNLLLRDHGGSPIPEGGADALKRVLYAAQQSLGIEYCPMLPDLTALFLTAMEESYAYATIREMLEDSSHFIALSRVEHVAWCKTFADLMKRLYPQTHAVLNEIGCLTPNALDPMFKRMFVTVLRRKHVLRIVDLFTLDGVEVLFRFGTALMCLYHAHMSVHDQFEITDATSWWDGVHNFCHSKKFHFEVFLKDQVYGFTAGRFRRRSIFPSRDYVERLICNNEDWAEMNLSSYRDAENDVLEERPLGFIEGEDTVPIVLARNAPERQRLAEWFPPTLKSTKLELIYSSNVHGRTIERFYHHCARARHTITLLEVLGKDTTVGMFATHTWHKNSRGYGNGECFIFRLKPNPTCFKWKQQQSSSSSLSGAASGAAGAGAGAAVAAVAVAVDPSGTNSFDSSSSSSAVGEDRPPPPKQAQKQFADQVMISDDHFISMGIGKDGASGLRLNEDLTRGSTSPAMGFGNESSLLTDESQVFDVGLVEVYRLVREVDGKPVDSM